MAAQPGLGLCAKRRADADRHHPRDDDGQRETLDDVDREVSPAPDAGHPARVAASGHRRGSMHELCALVYAGLSGQRLGVRGMEDV